MKLPVPASFWHSSTHKPLWVCQGGENICGRGRRRAGWGMKTIGDYSRKLSSSALVYRSELTAFVPLCTKMLEPGAPAEGILRLS
ncbi:hypothetical protein GDO81_010488 [Engystomops pustulosus]|uniref:Uncharacterized protein n=1 Tax=Engystomops pustulosus TaxID=76066 RepID=A0AAV7C0J3_ENGPU|nr:hypothetical protein GDO81_010488 [Engystomops pustulosus]